MNADGSAGAAKRISNRRGATVQSYERRMLIFNLRVILAALIVLALLIVWLPTVWRAFEKSVALTSEISNPAGFQTPGITRPKEAYVKDR